MLIEYRSEVGLSSHSAPPAEHRRNGLQQNYQIQSHGPFTDVARIQLDDLVKIHYITSPLHLPQSSDAWFGPKPIKVMHFIIG